MTAHDTRTPPTTGAQLQAVRRDAGYSQSALACLIGCSRNAVSYWENQSVIDNGSLRYGVPKRIGKALGFEPLPINRTSTRARGDGVLLWHDAQQRSLDREFERLKARLASSAARHRQQCGAQTRKGQPCRNMSEAGRRRCKFHGGCSTGPKTAEGKARISEAQKARWAAYRVRL